MIKLDHLYFIKILYCSFCVSFCMCGLHYQTSAIRQFDAILILQLIYFVVTKLVTFIMSMQHYEALVEEHFSRRSQYILMACKSYMEGAPVGCDAEFGQNEHQKGGSTGFKIMLGKLFVKLLEAFSEKGINCSQFTIPEK